MRWAGYFSSETAQLASANSTGGCGCLGCGEQGSGSKIAWASPRTNELRSALLGLVVLPSVVLLAGCGPNDGPGGCYSERLEAVSWSTMEEVFGSTASRLRNVDGRCFRPCSDSSLNVQICTDLNQEEVLVPAGCMVDYRVAVDISILTDCGDETVAGTFHVYSDEGASLSSERVSVVCGSRQVSLLGVGDLRSTLMLYAFYAPEGGDAAFSQEVCLVEEAPDNG